MKVYIVTLPPPIAVGELAAERPGDRAEQRPDERDLRGVQRGLRGVVAAGEEVDLQHLTEREREADERTERADVEEAHHPGVRVPQRFGHRAQVGPLVAAGCP